MSTFFTTNPVTGKRIKEYNTTTLSELTESIAQARSAQKQWVRLSIQERAACFCKLAAILESKKGELAKIISAEVGKSIAESIAEIERCEMPLLHYAKHGENLLADEIVETQALKSYIHFEPIGLVAIFIPWNYPAWGIFRQLGSALLCGNALIIKPYLKTAGSVHALLQVIQEIGFPCGLVSAVFDEKNLTEPLIKEVETVVAITSPHVGRIIGEIAGRHMKRINLQLSGSDPFIVLEDADVGEVARKAVASRLINGGQDCVAAKRFIVRSEVCEEFVRYFVEEMNKAKVGALGHENLLAILESQVKDAVEKGAKLLLGGGRVSGEGYFFQPTVLTSVTPEMKVWQEETFGPVAPIMSVASDEEAIGAVNDSPFGLGASVWTKDPKRGERIARRLESGVVAVNGQPKSHPALPFGGVKQTGMGRDFSKYGLLHFLNTKSVLVYES